MSATALLLAGGWVGWILIAMSVVVGTVIAVKLLQFHALRLRGGFAPEQALSAIERHQGAELHAEIRRQPHPRAVVLDHYLNLVQQQRLPQAALLDELQRVAMRQLDAMGNHLRIVDVSAMLAPLLGLFGTVLGMIDAFQAMESAGSQVSPQLLSGGIWTALLTTAIGLAVAMPATIALNALERKIEICARQLQDDIARLATFMSSAAEPVVAVSGRQVLR